LAPINPPLVALFIPSGIKLAAADQRELSIGLPMAPLNPGIPPTSSIFKAHEDAKAMLIEVKNLAKTMQIGASLDPK
jgi:hypothetical protein